MSEFRCAVCRGVFEQGWSDDEARAEAKELWGVTDKEIETACDVVCDDCFKAMTAVRPPDHSYIEQQRTEKP